MLSYHSNKNGPTSRVKPPDVLILGDLTGNTGRQLLTWFIALCFQWEPRNFLLPKVVRKLPAFLLSKSLIALSLTINNALLTMLTWTFSWEPLHSPIAKYPQSGTPKLHSPLRDQGAATSSKPILPTASEQGPGASLTSDTKFTRDL